MVENTKQIIGKYEILEKLGEGGFGIVYKAIDTSLDRSVALKQLKMELSSSPEYLDRFKRESRSMGSLNHPNIVKMLEVFEDSGRYFIVMDFMPNGSLADKLKDGKSLSIEETVEILKPIAKAVDYAHSKNLIHRDIKPSNILFMEGEDPALSDFGLVKSMDTKGQTTTGVSFGTPEYMSPEQILGKDLTPAVDLYALGVVAYQMLTGGTPFTGSTAFEIQEGHVHKPLPDIVEKKSGLPKEYSEIFSKMLAKDPGVRYTSAREFLKQLESFGNPHILAQYDDKLRIVRKCILEKEFALAIDGIKELIRINPNSSLSDLLLVCQQREKIWEELQRLIIQRDEIDKKISDQKLGESWIEGCDDLLLHAAFTQLGENEAYNNENPLGDSQNQSNLENERTQIGKWIIFWIITGLIVLIVVVIEIENFSGIAITLGFIAEFILTGIAVNVKFYDD